MIRKYHNHKLQTTPWHREEDPLKHHETPARQIKPSNQLSLPHQDDCNTRMDIQSPTKRCFSLFLPLNKALPKRLFFSILALILTKALQQIVFYSIIAPFLRVFFSMFALILTKAPPKRVIFSIFALILSKDLPNMFFLHFCIYLYQRPRCFTLILPFF